MKRLFLLAFTLFAFLILPNPSFAAYSLFDDASIVSGGNPGSAAQVISDAAPGWGGISFTVPDGLTFAQLTHLSADYKILSGGCGGGSPRFQLRIDGKNIFVHLGPGPNFTGCALNTWLTTDEFINSPNAVFDSTQLGGPYYGTYAQTLALFGDRTITGIKLVVDSGWMFANNQTVLFDNVKINDDTYTFEYPRKAEITSPLAGSQVSGLVNFTAFLSDDDADTIQWAVRKGTCAANTGTIFGNVDGHSDTALINTTDLENQTFSFTADMSLVDPGMYCFVYNPVEDSGESDIRLTAEFNLIKAAPTTKEECKNDGWKSFTRPAFKNQGDCVSYLQSSPNAKGNKAK